MHQSEELESKYVRDLSSNTCTCICRERERERERQRDRERAMCQRAARRCFHNIVEALVSDSLIPSARLKVDLVLFFYNTFGGHQEAAHYDHRDM